MLWEREWGMSELSKRPGDETQGQGGPGKRLERKARPQLTPEEAQRKKEKRIMAVMIAAAVLMVLAAAAVLLYNRWVKKPSLPPGPGETSSPAPADHSAEPTLSLEAVQPKVGGERKSGEIYTFLIFGCDVASGLTDSMMLVTYDVAGQEAAVMSLPRDTLINVRWSNKGLNTVYSYYGGGEDGVEALKQEVSELVGFVPDYYVKIDWELVGEMVDAIGGVWFDNPYHMQYYDPYQDLNIYQEKGYRKISGDDAMQIVRWRHNAEGIPGGGDGSDLSRLQVQHAFLKAVLKQTLQIQNIFRINQLAELFGERVESDLSVENIFWFAQEAIIGGLKVEDVDFCTMPCIGAGPYGSRFYGRVYPSQSELLTIVNEKLNPYVEQVTIKELDLIRASADGNTLSSSTGVLADPSAGYYTPPAAEPSPEASDPPEDDPGETGEPVGADPGSGDLPGDGDPAETVPAGPDPLEPVGSGGEEAITDWGETLD